MPVSVAIQHLNISRLNLSLERASLVVLVVQNPPANAGNMGVAGSIPGWEDPLEEVMATHSRILT